MSSEYKEAITLHGIETEIEQNTAKVPLPNCKERCWASAEGAAAVTGGGQSATMMGNLGLFMVGWYSHSSVLLEDGISLEGDLGKTSR